MLNKINFRSLYSSGESDSPISFFTDALSNSISFDLGLGFFSSASFNVLSIGVAKFISNGGKMRLYINQYLSEEDKKEKILENQKIIRTPIVRNGKQATVGYEPDVWKDWK